jgi:hypothetical protein
MSRGDMLSKAMNSVHDQILPLLAEIHGPIGLEQVAMCKPR